MRRILPPVYHPLYQGFTPCPPKLTISGKDDHPQEPQQGTWPLPLKILPATKSSRIQGRGNLWVKRHLLILSWTMQSLTLLATSVLAPSRVTRSRDQTKPVPSLSGPLETWKPKKRLFPADWIHVSSLYSKMSQARIPSQRHQKDQAVHLSGVSKKKARKVQHQKIPSFLCPEHPQSIHTATLVHHNYLNWSYQFAVKIRFSGRKMLKLEKPKRGINEPKCKLLHLSTAFKSNSALV